MVALFWIACLAAGVPCVMCSALSIAGALVTTQLSGVADPLGFPASFAEYLKKVNPDPHAANTLQIVADILERGLPSAHNLVRNLSEDAQVRLLWELWFDERTDRGEPPPDDREEMEIRRLVASGEANRSGGGW